jgi:hypothetical protein
VFTNTITPETPHDHNVLNYGKPLDDFYQITLLDEQLEIIAPYRGKKIINDKFNIDQQGNYIFCARSDMVRINEVVLEHSFFQLALSMRYDIDTAFLIPDSTTNKIYLLCDIKYINHNNNNIKEINEYIQNYSPLLQLDFVDYVSIGDFFDAKFNVEQAKAHFRTKFSLT